MGFPDIIIGSGSTATFEIGVRVWTLKRGALKRYIFCFSLEALSLFMLYSRFFVRRRRTSPHRCRPSDVLALEIIIVTILHMLW